MPKRTNDGIRKRCGCTRRDWAKCSHPWHFNFKHDGRVYRFSINDHEKKPHGYRMPKTEALALREGYREAIRHGRFIDDQTTPSHTLTFGDCCDRYIAEHVNVPTRTAASRYQFTCYVNLARRADVPAANGTTVRLEQKAITDVTRADIRAVCDWRLRVAAEKAAKGVETDKAGHVGVNRLKARLRHLFNWLIEHDYVQTTPFREHGRTRVKLNRDAERERDRRLVGDEEARLLKHAGPHMQALIVAALETGCRLGELLGLVWRDVNLSPRDGAIYLRAARTKTGKARAIPITSRLRALLVMRRNGPDGEPLPPTAHVFGNEVGEPIARIKTAWLATCRRAGIADLHFHDLRREFASRLLESPNVNTANVRDWLGHANITTTSRYLKTTIAGLKDVAKNFEASRAGDASRADGIAQGLHKPADHDALPETASPDEVSQIQ